MKHENALVERGISIIAVKPLFEQKETASKKKHFKTASELPMGSKIKLIEDYYNIRLSDIKDYSQINLIRNKVNSFKHRKVLKILGEMIAAEFGEKHEISRKEALHGIDSVRSFFKELWIKTKNLEWIGKSSK